MIWTQVRRKSVGSGINLRYALPRTKEFINFVSAEACVPGLHGAVVYLWTDSFINLNILPK